MAHFFSTQPTSLVAFLLGQVYVVSHAGSFPIDWNSDSINVLS